MAGCLERKVVYPVMSSITFHVRDSVGKLKLTKAQNMKTESKTASMVRTSLNVTCVELVNVPFNLAVQMVKQLKEVNIVIFHLPSFQFLGSAEPSLIECFPPDPDWRGGVWEYLQPQISTFPILCFLCMYYCPWLVECVEKYSQSRNEIMNY